MRGRRPLDGLTALSRAVDDIANVAPNPRQPFVGRVAFAHKGGIHVHAVARDPSHYEHLDPALVGNERRIMVSELSGRATISKLAEEFGVHLEPGGDAERVALGKVKQLESQGFQFEDAAASFELLVRRCDTGYDPPFAPLAYAVDSRKGSEDGGTVSFASAEVAVGGEVLRGEATGNGPVDALEKAVRRALTPAYPNLTQVGLTDFRSHIARPLAGERGRSRCGSPAACRGRAVDDDRELGRPAARELARAHREPRVRGAHARRRQRERRGRAAPGHGAHLVARPGCSARRRADARRRGGPRRGRATDWTTTALDISDAADRTLAACATALGAAIFYSFGNFCGSRRMRAGSPCGA